MCRNIAMKANQLKIWNIPETPSWAITPATDAPIATPEI